MTSDNGKTQGMACFERKPDYELKMWEYDMPKMDADMVEIKITHCGVCHSDIHTCNGEWGPGVCPIVSGHEIIGTITKMGENVKKFHVGQRVGVGPQAFSCGECQNCKAGLETVCRGFVGTYGGKLPNGDITQGGYALHNRTNQRFVVAIPDSCDSASAAPLLCAGVTTFAPLKRFKVGPGSRVGVIGIGGLGHCGIQLAKAMGAHVAAFSSSSNKEQEAKNLGADEFVVTKEFTDEKKLAEFLKTSANYDVILNTVSADLDLSLYLQLLAPRGVFVTLALPPSKYSFAPTGLIMGEKSITGSLIGTPSDFEDMFKLVDKHGVKAMVEVVPLEKANEAVEKVVKNQVRYRMVLEMPKN